MITTEEFDRLADLPVDDPAGDVEPYMDHMRTRRPGREVQRVNVDFPIDLLHAIDREATRLGVTRQAFIKIRLADTLPTHSSRWSDGPDVSEAQLAAVGQDGKVASSRPVGQRASSAKGSVTGEHTTSQSGAHERKRSSLERR
jgi:hypothetical protein